jgi:DNA-binding transcriptional regulator of glucitol operon
MMQGNPALMIIPLAAAWLLQLLLSARQMRRYYARLRHLRQYGRVAVGVAGSAWRRRVYGLLAVDEEGRVVRAEVLKGWTVFAQPQPAPALHGRTIQEILDGQVSGLTAKELSAFQQAAAFAARRPKGVGRPTRGPRPDRKEVINPEEPQLSSFR